MGMFDIVEIDEGVLKKFNIPHKASKVIMNYEGQTKDTTNSLSVIGIDSVGKMFSKCSSLSLNDLELFKDDQIDIIYKSDFEISVLFTDGIVSEIRPLFCIIDGECCSDDFRPKLPKTAEELDDENRRWENFQKNCNYGYGKDIMGNILKDSIIIKEMVKLQDMNLCDIMGVISPGPKLLKEIQTTKVGVSGGTIGELEHPPTYRFVDPMLIKKNKFIFGK